MTPSRVILEARAAGLRAELQVLEQQLAKLPDAELDGGRPLTLAEAAEQVGVSLRTLERWVATGDFPIVRAGRSRRVRRADLERWVAARRTGVGS